MNLYQKEFAKLEKKYQLSRTPTGAYGVVSGKFFQIHKEDRCHRVRIGFFEVTETIRRQFEATRRKLRISKISYSEKWVLAEFRDLLPLIRFRKIESVLVELNNILGQYDSSSVPSCIQCGTSTAARIYRHDVSLMPLCPHCAEEISASLRKDIELFRDAPTKYPLAFSSAFAALVAAGVLIVWASMYAGDLTLFLIFGLSLLATRVFRKVGGKPGRFPGLVLGVASTAAIASAGYVIAQRFATTPSAFDSSVFATKYLKFFTQNDPIVYVTATSVLLFNLWMIVALWWNYPRMFELEVIDLEDKK